MENTQIQFDRKQKPSFFGEAKTIEIKMKIKDEGEKQGKGKERKTLQHISSKKPPFLELKGAKEVRTSF